MQGIELMELIYPSFKESVGTVTVTDDKTLTQITYWKENILDHETGMFKGVNLSNLKHDGI